MKSLIHSKVKSYVQDEIAEARLLFAQIDDRDIGPHMRERILEDVNKEFGKYPEEWVKAAVKDAINDASPSFLEGSSGTVRSDSSNTTYQVSGEFVVQPPDANRTNQIVDSGISLATSRSSR